MSDEDDGFDRHQWERRDTLIYKLRLSALYHQKRGRYYELTDKLFQAVAVLGSTAAVIQLLAENRGAQLWASAAVAVVSTLSLVYAPSSKANTHVNLVRDFHELLASVHAAGEHPEPSQLDGWYSNCVSLEAQEPSNLCALVAECQYQLNLSAPPGSAPVARPSRAKRLMMHVIDFQP